MKPAETQRTYTAACRSKRLVPQQEEMNRWHKVLRDYEARDVETALDAWWSDTTITSTGRPKGAFLPEPAELKPLVESIRGKREAEAREPHDYLVWRCPKGHALSRFIARSKPTPETHAPCEACKLEMKPERFPA